MTNIQKLVDVHRTALAMFRAAATGDDEGLDMLRAVQDPADAELLSSALERVEAEASRAARAVGMDAFYDAYSAAIDATEEQILGR